MNSEDIKYVIAFDIVCGNGKSRRWYMGHGSVWLPANTKHQHKARTFNTTEEAIYVMDHYDVPFGAFVAEAVVK